MQEGVQGWSPRVLILRALSLVKVRVRVVLCSRAMYVSQSNVYVSISILSGQCFIHVPTIVLSYRRYIPYHVDADVGLDGLYSSTPELYSRIILTETLVVTLESTIEKDHLNHNLRSKKSDIFSHYNSGGNEYWITWNGIVSFCLTYIELWLSRNWQINDVMTMSPECAIRSVEKYKTVNKVTTHYQLRDGWKFNSMFLRVWGPESHYHH